MKIRYYKDRVYGLVKMYPVDFVDAVYRLTGRKTLLESDVAAFKELGIEFEEVSNPKYV